MARLSILDDLADGTTLPETASPETRRETAPRITILDDLAEPNASLHSSLYSASLTDPDAEAKKREQAKTLGVPAGALPPDPEAAIFRKTAQSAVADFPALSSWLENIDNAKVARDDLPALSGVEKAMKAVIGGYLDVKGATQDLSGLPGRMKDVGVSVAKSIIAVPETVVGLMDYSPAASLYGATKKALSGDRVGIEDLVSGGHIGRALEELGFKPGEAKAFLDTYYSPEQQSANKAVTDAKGFVDTAAAAVKNPSTIGHAIIESLAPMFAGGAIGRGLVAAKAASPLIAGAIGEGVVGAGLFIEGVRQQTEDGLVSGKQMVAGLAAGAGTALFGALGGKISQRLGVIDVDTLIANGANKELAELVISKGFAQKLIAGGISEGVFEEMPQSMQEQMWRNVATDKPIMDGVFEAGAMGMVTGFAMGGVFNTLYTGNRKDQAEVKRANETLQKLMKLSQEAEAAKTRTRSPDAFASFVKQVSSDAVYIDARTFYQSMEKAGVTPEKLAEIAPETAKQVAEAVSLGGDLVIPYSELVGGLQAYSQPLLPDMRASQEHASANQAEATLKENKDQFNARAEKILAAKETGDEFRNSAKALEEKLLADLTGNSPHRNDVNKASLAPIMAFYVTSASKRGITPEQAYNEHPIRFGGQVAGSTFSQGKKPADQAIPRADNLQPQDRIIESVFAEKIASDYPAVVDEYSALSDSQGGKILNVDTAREMSPDYSAGRDARSLLSSAVHEPASYFIKQLYADKLAAMPKDSTVMFTSGGTGAGKSTAINNVSEVKAVMDRSYLVYDTNMNSLKSAIQKVNQALSRGAKVEIVHVQRDPIDALIKGALPRAMRMGRSVPLSAHEATHIGSAETIIKLSEHYKDDPRVNIRILDNTNGKGRTKQANIDFVKGFDYNGLRERLISSLHKEYQNGNINEAIYAGTLGDTNMVRAASDARIQDGLPSGDRGGVANSSDSGGKERLSAEELGTRQGNNGLERQLTSKDQTDTPEFKAWFGNSVVTEDGKAGGKPLVVYHGTKAEFYVFSLSKIGQNGLSVGPGFYFTDSKDVAEGYGQAMSVYLSAQNPSLSTENRTITKAQVQKIIEAMEKEDADFLSNYGDIDYEGRAKVVRSALDDIYSSSKNDAEIIGSLINVGGVPRDSVMRAVIDVTGKDGFVVGADIASFAAKDSDKIYTVLLPTQIKSSLGNNGQFSPNNPSILLQQNHGSITFGDDLSQGAVINLFENANLTTLLHESGHFFLAVTADIASRPDAPQSFKDDMNATMDWFGIKDTPEQSKLDIWLSMPRDQQESYHEQFARGFELYLFEGKSPNPELNAVFRRFRDWMVYVYKTIQNLKDTFKQQYGRELNITPEIRNVFDSLIATDEQIEMAKQGEPQFNTAEEAKMTEAEFADYQKQFIDAPDEAREILQTRGLKDMKWLNNARSALLKAMQKESAALRRVARMDARREVLTQPIYKAWQFLGGKMPKVAKAKAVKVRDILQTIIDEGGISNSYMSDVAGEKTGLPRGLFKSTGTDLGEMAVKLLEQGFITQAQFDDETDSMGMEHVTQLIRAALNGEEILNEQDQIANEEQNAEENYRLNLMDEARDKGIKLHPEYPYTIGELFNIIDTGNIGVESSSTGKLSIPVMRQLYGEEGIWNQIDKTLTAEEGMPPDMVAELFGIPTGQGLVDLLATLPDQQDAIENLTDRIMLERHGDLTSEEALTHAVNEAIHNKAHSKFLATELSALERITKSVKTMTGYAKKKAVEIISGRKIRDVKPSQFILAEKRARQASGRAFKKGDFEASRNAKLDEIINSYAAAEAYQSIKDVEKAVAAFKVIVGRSDKAIAKTHDLGLVYAVRAMLLAHDIGTAKAGTKVNEYLRMIKDYSPDDFDRLNTMVLEETLDARNYRDMTVEEFRGFTDRINGLMHQSISNKVMMVDGQNVALDKVKDELFAVLEKRGIPEKIPGEDSSVTGKETFKFNVLSVLAAYRRVQSWVQAKDGVRMGAWRKYVWNTINEANIAYDLAAIEYGKKYNDLLKEISPTLKKETIDAPELYDNRREGSKGYVFGQDNGGQAMVELLHALLHSGNQSNFEKMLLGRGWAEMRNDMLDTSRWDKFVARMIKEKKITKAHYDFAQGVWDLLESMKPAAQKTHMDVFGRYFNEITARPFNTPFGMYAGGYVPALTDPRAVKDAQTRKLAEEEGRTMSKAFPSTGSGWAKDRVRYNEKLHLDLRILSQHINKVLLFTHMEKPIRDVRRVLTDRKLATALHRVDPSAMDGLISPWLERVSLQQVETPVSGLQGAMKLLSKVRSRAGMNAMFANLSNTAQQISGISTALVKFKGNTKYLLKAHATYLRDPKGVTEMIVELSGYMTIRMNSEMSNLVSDMNEILLNPNLYQDAKAWSAKHAYFMQQAVDNVISSVVWLGAFNRAMEEQNDMTPQEREKYAVQLADSAVTETQGAMRPIDVSRMETGNAFVRWFTQFAGYFNMIANLLATEYSGIVHDEIGIKNKAYRALYVTLFGYLAGAWVGEAIAQLFRGGPEDEDKDGEYLDDWMMAVFGYGTLRYGAPMLPGGQLVTPVINATNDKPYDDRISTGPAISTLENAVVGTYKDVLKLSQGGDVKPSKIIRDVGSLVTLATGIPVVVLAKPAGYLADIEADRVYPTSNLDMVRGIATGAASPESKGR